VLVVCGKHALPALGLRTPEGPHATAGPTPRRKFLTERKLGLVTVGGLMQTRRVDAPRDGQ